MWPDTPENAKYAPPATLQATAISAGVSHACGISAADSTLVCWGSDVFGPPTPPPSLGPVKAVSAGMGYSCAITQPGGVVCFGNPTLSAVPAGLEAGAIAVSAGASHVCALTADGAPLCWGSNMQDQATPPPGLVGLKQIVAGIGYTAAVDAAGNVVVWGGNNANGRLTPPAGIQGAVEKISGGATFHLCAVTKTGGVWCSTSIAPAMSYACASLASEGRVVCFGPPALKQTEVPAGLSGVTQVATSNDVAYALQG